jgi:beta-lactamase class A
MSERIEEIVRTIDGRMGVCVLDLTTGEEVGVRLDEPLPMASVCKIPILVAAYRAHDSGTLDLSERVLFTQAKQCFGSGLFNAFDFGLRPTVRDLLLMMIVVSDNAATDLVLERVTIEGVNEAMRALGHKYIRIDRNIAALIGDLIAATDPLCIGVAYSEWEGFLEEHPEIKAKDRDLHLARTVVNETAADRDVATVREIARLCAQIAHSECADLESCKAMTKILEKQQLNGRLPRDLPAFTKFPHKTGTLGSGAVVNDAGVLYLNEEPVAAVAVLSRDVKNPIHETNSAIAAIGQAVYGAYGSRVESRESRG